MSNLDVTSIQEQLKTKISRKHLNEGLDVAVSLFESHKKEGVPVIFQICSLLLAAGARVTIPKDTTEYHSKWKSPINIFHYCCFYGNLSVLQQFVKMLSRRDFKYIMHRNAVIKPVHYSDTVTPLACCIIGEHMECTDFVLSHYKLKHARNITSSLEQVSRITSRTIKQEVLKVLLQQLTKYGLLDLPMYSWVLGCAFYYTNFPLFKILVENYRCFNEIEYEHLMDMVINRDIENILELLHRHHSDVYIPTNIRMCALEPNIFAETKHIEAWQVICQYARKKPPTLLHQLLMKTAVNGNPSCLQYMLQDGFRELLDLNSHCTCSSIVHRSYIGETVLTAVLSNCSLGSRRICCQEFMGEPIDRSTNANLRRRNYMFKLLLDHGIDTDVCNLNRDSPLYIVVDQVKRKPNIYRYNYIKTLLRYGCDVNVLFSKPIDREHPSTNSLSAAVYAFGQAIPGLLQMLILAGGDVSKIQPMPDTEGMNNADKNVKYLRMCQVMIERDVMEARSLKQLSRLQIRSVLRFNIPGKLTSLAGVIPPFLREYLLIPEMEDIAMFPDSKQLVNNC